MGFVRVGNFQPAEELLQKVLQKEPKLPQVLELLADIKLYLEKEDEAIALYEKAIANEGKDYLWYKLAIASMDGGAYEKCLTAIATYESLPKARKESIEKLQRYKTSATFALEAIKNPVPFAPQNMGAQINTEHLEYLPSLSADGKTLIYTSRRLTGDQTDEDFFVSYKEDGAWTKGARLQGYLNTELNEGAQCITADGKKLYFTACHREDGFGSCDIYESYYLGNGKWGKAKNLGSAINSPVWESQPSISPDGKDLYFVRGKDSFGGVKNIWVSHLRQDGTWTKAMPLPENINTQFEEEAPFMYFDNETLFFTSDGHPGFGRKDFFYTKKQPDGSWGTPVNLGYPINTHRNEFSLVIGPDGFTTIFASNRAEGSNGDLDLFWFEMPKEHRTVPVAWVKGTIRDAKTKKPQMADIELYDLSSGALFTALKSGEIGDYFAVLPVNRDYALNIAKEGYLFFSENFSLADSSAGGEYLLDVSLQPIEKGATIALRNIFFDTDKFDLKETSQVELDQIVKFLTANSNLRVRFEGHTDNMGNPTYNKTLSEKRAQAVRNYLVDKGIAAKRMEAQGFGETQPVADNETEEGRAMNRRTEMRIL